LRCREKRVLVFILCLSVFFSSVPTACALVAQKGLPAQNTVILWTDRSFLKAITLVTIKPGHLPVGIISIPVITRLDDCPKRTLADLYALGGQRELLVYLEKHFDIPIQTYFSIDQNALFLASEIIGPLNMQGKRMTMLDVFEGTYAGERYDLETEVRMLAYKMLEPEILVKIPRLIRVFTTHVDTNLTPWHLISFYQLLRGEGPEILRKEALPGTECTVEGVPSKEVAPDTWTRVLQSVTSK